MSRYGLDLQLQTYGAQTPPAFPVVVEEWEERARTILSPEAFGYVAGGAGAEDTMRANRDAFYRTLSWRCRDTPRSGRLTGPP